MINKIEMTTIAALRDALYKHNSGLVRVNESLKERTTYRVGGEAQILYSPYEVADIRATIQIAKDLKVPFRILGGGSNLLVADHGVPGLTIELGSYFQGVVITDTLVSVQSGIKLLRLTRLMCELGLSGLENLAGIPGTLGGGLWMNCGAFGSEISDHIIRVNCLDQSGNSIVYQKSDIAWGYRSAPELNDKVIVSALFHFKQSDRDSLIQTMRDTVALRREKQPLQYPSAGSVFKRPPNLFAGKLIEEAGLKGFQIGGAQVSTKHAGFIVNTGSATASDIRDLMQHIQAEVQKKCNVRLELEQCLWGFQNAAV